MYANKNYRCSCLIIVVCHIPPYQILIIGCTKMFFKQFFIFLCKSVDFLLLGKNFIDRKYPVQCFFFFEKIVRWNILLLSLGT